MLNTFSIIICTYNRSAQLSRCVQSVFEQDYPRDCQEVVIVDNNSSDNTSQVAKELTKSSPVPCAYYVEERQGLSRARNCGIRHSRNDFIVYLDDDATADTRWLSVFNETINAIGADVVGGKIIPLPEEGFTPPAWFDSMYVKGFFGLDYSTWGYKEKIIPIEHPLYLGGGNSCYRKSLFALPWVRYDSGLGRTGKKLYQGEETLLNFFLKKAGYKIFYNADAVIYHYVDFNCVNKKHILKKAFWGGYSDAWMHRKMFGRRYVYKRAFIEFKKSVRNYRIAFKRKGEVTVFERRCLLSHELGYLLRMLKFWDIIV